MVRTDHHSLKYLLDQKIGTPMQQKWLSKVMGYDFVVEFKKRAENRVADALSRQGEEEEFSVALLSVPSLDWLEEIKEWYKGDPRALEILSKCQQGQEPQHYLVREGVLYYKDRVYIASNSELKGRLLEFLHGSSWGGHSGMDKTIHKVTREFYWPKLKSEVRAFVRNCPICQQQKTDHTLPNGLLQPLPVPSQPWTHHGLH